MNTRNQPRAFADHDEAMRTANQEPLGKVVWVEAPDQPPRDTFTPRKGHYEVKPLGPVAAAKRRAQLDAAERLRTDFGLVPGSTVHTILRHASRSGMFRRISLVMVGKDGSVRDFTRLAAVAMNDKEPRWNEDGIGVSGCGMDMGFNLVYGLSRTLYPFGFTCPGKGCPSNDHHNDRANKPRKGKRHTGDGGHAISHRWL